MNNLKHILVIRLSAMGDVAMVVPALAGMAENYPYLKFTVLTRKFYAPIFKDIPNVEIFEADVKGKHKGIVGLKQLAQQLKEREIDAVADLHNVLRSNVLKVFFGLYKIPVKQIDKGRAEKRALTRKNNKILKPLKTTHQRYADVFEALDFPIDLNTFKFQKKQFLSPLVMDLVGDEPKKWVGIAPFAQHESKMYPQDLMEVVLNKLQSFEKVKFFLFGGGNREIKLMSEWEKRFSNIVSMAGKISFEEELALISNLDVMLSMDSGNGHIAANFGIPVVSLWGLTHPFTGFAPFAQPETNSLYPDLEKYPLIPTSVYGTVVPAGYKDAMRSITPGKVVDKLKEVLFTPPASVLSNAVSN